MAFKSVKFLYIIYSITYFLQLTSEEVKSRLGKSKNLSELQAKLRKVTDCSAKVKEFQNQMQLKKFGTLELNIEVPVR